MCTRILERVFKKILLVYFSKSNCTFRELFEKTLAILPLLTATNPARITNDSIFDAVELLTGDFRFIFIPFQPNQVHGIIFCMSDSLRFGDFSEMNMSKNLKTIFSLLNH